MTTPASDPAAGDAGDPGDAAAGLPLDAQVALAEGLEWSPSDEPGQAAPAPSGDPGAPLLCGTYALYVDDRGGVVAVVRDGRTGEVSRYLAPPLVLRALRSRFPVLRAD